MTILRIHLIHKKGWSNNHNLCLVLDIAVEVRQNIFVVVVNGSSMSVA